MTPWSIPGIPAGTLMAKGRPLMGNQLELPWLWTTLTSRAKSCYNQEGKCVFTLPPVGSRHSCPALCFTRPQHDIGPGAMGCDDMYPCCRKATITLQRHAWEQLVMEHIQAFTDKPHAREDFSLACRQVTANLPQNSHSTQIVIHMYVPGPSQPSPD